ncbi:hypothetical protein GWK47_042288 [Chionoecetes opilio]|uniref:Uncharacterized protein n=1 Tax=Chionoecetes opilio TaxID=41210 RepID=A0A8J5CWF9_CHIOP|nr:hypothetical protein GWK47_042288 [Chionoecetes opilio]
MLHFNLSRCRIMRMACHVSGSILAEIGGALTGAFLDLAVASDEAAQELMINLTNRNPDFKPRGLVLALNCSYGAVSVFNKIQGRLKEKISAFIFTAAWRPDKELCIPDALSRSPVSKPTDEDNV